MNYLGNSRLDVALLRGQLEVALARYQSAMRLEREALDLDQAARRAAEEAERAQVATAPELRALATEASAAWWQLYDQVNAIEQDYWAALRAARAGGAL